MLSSIDETAFIPEARRRAKEIRLRGRRSCKVLNKVIKISTCELLLLPCDKQKDELRTSFMHHKSKSNMHERAGRDG